MTQTNNPHHPKRFISVAVFVMLLLAGTSLFGQNVNIEELSNIGERKLFRAGGSVSVNSTFYDAFEMFGRQPFTWQLNGSLNLSFLELINMPLSFNLNNFGAQYSLPSLPNRLSLHPSYKWARAHIGDVSMTFSPYTLNGHLFTGGGVELTPNKWQIAAMGGRLTRHVDYNPELPGLLPTYNRWGGGARLRYTDSRYFIGGSFFAAEDRVGETSFQTDSLGIFPMSNTAVSIEGGVNLTANLRLSAEYGISRLVRDTRPHINPESGELDDRDGTTHLYQAIRASLDYTFRRNTIGLGYERIDPDYQTLGAFFFNNDYENITLSYARPLFNSKGNLALSGGVQRDNLDNSQESENTRLVGSANLAYAPTDNLNMALSVSTFQGHKVIKSQFDYINQTRPYENLDTLNFTQISQNVDFNLNWTIQNNERLPQNITLFVGYQEAGSRQGNYILPGNLSRFLNAATIYGIDVLSMNTSFNAGVNVSNNYSNSRNLLTLGPSLGANLRLFERKMMTGIAFSYNRSYNDSVPMADVFNIRWNANTRIFEKHTLQASTIWQYQKRMSQTSVETSHVLTAQIGYIYNF